MSNPDTIFLRGLRVSCHVGVPDGEREAPQELQFDLTLIPREGWGRIGDDIDKTVDYYQVSLSVESVARARPRRLIETLATDIADHLLADYPLRSVTVEVRKFILPNTDHVAVRISREAR